MEEIGPVLLGMGGMIAVNVIGWVITSQRDDKKRAEWFGSIGQQVKSVDAKVEQAHQELCDLPCRKPEYFHKQGEMDNEIRAIRKDVNRHEDLLMGKPNEA